jgi:WD40 repeat protein
MLRLLEFTSSQPHSGEVYSCAYTPDGDHVLSGGWDGHLRLWDAVDGECRLSLPASPKPISACARSPDGTQWLVGSMEGLLTIWDAVSQYQLTSFVAHTRPISAITFSPDGQLFATSSWDRVVSIRKVGREREGRNLALHSDIVAGCQFTTDGRYLLSWSYDGTIKVWDIALAHEVATLRGHTDRVITLSLSPDGLYALSGGRDGTIRLWDLEKFEEVGTVNLGAEVRVCFYLLDGESIVVSDAIGRLFLMGLPSFEVQAQMQTPFRALCGDMKPAGDQVALGAEDGRIYFVALDGYDQASLVVTPREDLKSEANLFDRFFGKTRMTRVFKCTCPSCRQTVELASIPAQPVHCPSCHRSLRISSRVAQLQPT